MGKAIIYMVVFAIALFAGPSMVVGQQGENAEKLTAVPLTTDEDSEKLSTAPLRLVENPPSRYVVVKGDTLWDISARFLKDPWRWPDIWGLNRDAISNPHWIYPGDVIVLDFTGKTPRLRFESDTGWTLVNQRLSPQMRSGPLDSSAVPTISETLLRSFLSNTLVVDANELEIAPRIVSGQDGRTILGPGDIAYARGVSQPEMQRYFAVRPGRNFVDPDTGEFLGKEAIFLGETKVQKQADITTLKINRAVREINPGDRLLVADNEGSIPYMPHSPSRNISGKVVAAANEGVSEIGPLTVVVLNRGVRDGMEVGHVLELSRAGDTIKPAGAKDDNERITLPSERYGVVFVFKVYQRLSFALVMNTTRPVQVNDFVLTPS